MNPTGHVEVQEIKGGARFYLNGQELLVVKDGLEIETRGDGYAPHVTITFIPETVLLSSRRD